MRGYRCIFRAGFATGVLVYQVYSIYQVQPYRIPPVYVHIKYASNCYCGLGFLRDCSPTACGVYTRPANLTLARTLWRLTRSGGSLPCAQFVCW